MKDFEIKARARVAQRCVELDELVPFWYRYVRTDVKKEEAVSLFPLATDAHLEMMMQAWREEVEERKAKDHA